MRFTVVWTEEAKNALCELFMAVPNPGEFSRVVNGIESELACRPEDVGESRDQHVRVVMVAHVGILFEVHPDDCLVQVLHIGWLP